MPACQSSLPVASSLSLLAQNLEIRITGRKSALAAADQPRRSTPAGNSGKPQFYFCWTRHTEYSLQQISHAGICPYFSARDNRATVASRAFPARLERRVRPARLERSQESRKERAMATQLSPQQMKEIV